ncbi:MAG: hypothetical protein VCB77_06650, partial [Alphaproteobacteria bacterium]
VVEGGRAVGVRLEDGEVIRGRAALSNADPKRSFLELVDADDSTPSSAPISPPTEPRAAASA